MYPKQTFINPTHLEKSIDRTTSLRDKIYARGALCGRLK